MIRLPVRPPSISPPIRSIFFLFLHNLYPSNHKQSIKYVLFSHFFAKSVLSALFSCLRNLGASYSFMGSIFTLTQSKNVYPPLAYFLRE